MNEGIALELVGKVSALERKIELIEQSQTRKLDLIAEHLVAIRASMQKFDEIAELANSLGPVLGITP